ncbi:MAG: hypothetical protein K2M76_04575, partial [Muribaculaceae bacterium]|nr:hypothetical protein [Muribaculaceae bacterium]
YLLDSSSDLLINEISDVEIVPLKSTPGSKTYEMRFKVNKAFYDIYNKGSFKLLMLANWYGSYPDGLVPGVTTLTDIVESQAAVADYSEAWPALLSVSSRIPMFGIAQFDNVELRPMSLVVLQNKLHLLRALAKVEVFDSPTSEDEIQSVSMTRFNTRYSMAPAGVKHQDDYVKNNYDADYNSSLTIPAESESDVPLSFSRTADGSFVCYVPEFRNIGRDDNEKTRLLVTYPNGHTYYVDFKYYQNPPEGSKVGDAFDLRRNYWYRYSLSHTRDFDIEVVVVPYAETILDPNFGLLAPVPDDDVSNYDPVVNTSDTTIIYYRNSKTDACLAPDKATPIADPAKTIDAATGYQIVQTSFPGRGNVVYFYYDPVRKVQLAPDRKTYVRTVFSINEPGYVIYIELQANDDNRFVPTGTSYYFQSYTNVWYDDIPTRKDNPPTIVNPYPAP